MNNEAIRNPVFKTTRTLTNPTGWWVLMDQKQWDKFEFHPFVAADYLISCYEKATGVLIGTSSNLLNFAGNIKIKKFNKTFNELAADKALKFTVRHRHYNRPPPDSSIRLYCSMLELRLNVLQTPEYNWNPIFSFEQTATESTNPYIMFRVMQKQNKMQGLTSPPVTLYKDDDNQHYILATVGAFESDKPKYEKYINSKGINPSQLIDQLDQDDKLRLERQTLRSGIADERRYVCPVFNTGEVERFVLDLYCAAFDLRPLSATIIIDPEQGVPHAISPLGMMINADQYSTGSVCLLESSVSQDSFASLDISNYEWYGDLKIPTDLEY